MIISILILYSSTLSSELVVWFFWNAEFVLGAVSCPKLCSDEQKILHAHEVKHEHSDSFKAIPASQTIHVPCSQEHFLKNHSLKFRLAP